MKISQFWYSQKNCTSNKMRVSRFFLELFQILWTLFQHFQFDGFQECIGEKCHLIYFTSKFKNSDLNIYMKIYKNHKIMEMFIKYKMLEKLHKKYIQVKFDVELIYWCWHTIKPIYNFAQMIELQYFHSAVFEYLNILQYHRISGFPINFFTKRRQQKSPISILELLSCWESFFRPNAIL